MLKQILMIEKLLLLVVYIAISLFYEIVVIALAVG